MPRTTTKRTMLRAAAALAIALALPASAALAQTGGAAADQPLIYHADPNGFSALARPVIAPPSAVTATAAPAAIPGSGGPLFNQDLTVSPRTGDRDAADGGALAPALIFHTDPNAFSPLSRPVIVPPRAISGSPFAPAPAGVTGTGVPIEPSRGGSVSVPTFASGDLFAGPSLRRGAGATRTVIGRAGSNVIASPETTLPSGVNGNVVITNRQGRARIVTR